VTPKIATRSADCLQRIVSWGMAVLVGLSLATATVAAQGTTSLGTGSARISLSARLLVGYTMRVRQAQPARIVERTATATEVELPVTAASNANWTLSVANQPGSPDIEIFDANGTWRDLDGGSTVAVYASGQPTNGHPVAVRLRLAPGATLDSLMSIRLLMTPSER